MFTTTSTNIVDSINSMPSLFSFETNHELLITRSKRSLLTLLLRI